MVVVAVLVLGRVLGGKPAGAGGEQQREKKRQAWNR
jgi:hypothetical protein